MKFEYECGKEDRDCVAYLENEGGSGHLVIKDLRQDSSSFVLMPDAVKCNTTAWDKWRPDGAFKKFYPGDKITITF